MEIHKNTNQQLNELLKEARQDKPVMNLKEVESVISNGKFTPVSGNKGFHFGMNNIIVIGGIAISSFLAYMTLKVDKQAELAAPAVHNESVAVQNSSPDVTIQPAQELKSDALSSEAAPAKEEKSVRPALNTSTLTASSNKGMTDNDLAPVEPVAASAASKMPSGEYVITFNYDGQDIKMKLIGEDISEFSVDGHAVTENQYGEYEDIIAEGKNYLIGNTKEEDGTSSLNLIRYFDEQLRADQVLSGQTQYHFELSFSQLLIDGVAQSETIFKKYRDLYQSKTGKTITEGSVYKFEKGARSE